MSGMGGGGGMAAAGAGCGQQKCTSLCRSAFVILTLVMPTPWDLHISTCGTHCTVSLASNHCVSLQCTGARHAPVHGTRAWRVGITCTD